MTTILTLGSMGVHAYLTLQHYSLKLGLSSGKSLCNINEKFNCDAVAISRYSTLIDAPIALWGFFTHLLVLILLLSLLLKTVENRSRMARYIHTLALGIALVSIVMALIAWIKLGTFCLFCILAYFLSFITLNFTWKLAHQWSSSLKKDLQDLVKHHRWMIGLGALLPFVTYLSHLLILDSFGFSKLHLYIQESQLKWQNAPQQNFSLHSDPKNGLFLYSPDVQAPLGHPEDESQNNGGEYIMTIVEFADYLCPHCKMSQPTLHAFVRTHNRVRFVYKFFPLDGTCNPSGIQKGDGLRCQLAQAVYCAEKLFKKGWNLQEWIFSKQEYLHPLGGNFPKVLEEMNSHLFVDSEGTTKEAKPPISTEQQKMDFQNCIQGEESFQAVRSQAEEGQRAQIRGTPTLFINGKELEKGQFDPFLQAVYESLF